MSRDSEGRRKQLDRERYLRHQEERKASQRAYYKANREAILARKRKTGAMKYGLARGRQKYSCQA